MTSPKRLTLLAGLWIMMMAGCNAAATTTHDNERIIEGANPTPGILTATPILMIVTESHHPTIIPILPTITVVPTETTVTNSSESRIVWHEGCLSIVNTKPFPPWPGGSVLFNSGPIRSSYQQFDIIDPDPSGIWAISVNSDVPQLVYDSLRWALMSPDGTILLNFDGNTESTTDETIFYDMVNDSEVRLTFPFMGYGSVTWLSDGRVQYSVVTERVEYTSETRAIVTVDPVTEQTDVITKEIGLPGYFYDPHDLLHGVPSGYDALDPTGELILYTALTDGNTYIRLYDYQADEIIWQQKSSLPGYLEPTWTDDGQRVFFKMRMSISDSPYGYDQIVSLTRDGQIESLPSQPFPITDETQIRYLTFSPDRRYIVYALETWGVRAFVVDTFTAEVREICGDQFSFLDGYWLPENQFIYRVLIQNGGQWSHSLRVLNTSTWASHVVFEPRNGNGVNIFGWTPIEFP